MDGFWIDLKQQLTPGALAAGGMVASTMAALAKLLSAVPRGNAVSAAGRVPGLASLAPMFLLGGGVGCFLMACTTQAEPSQQQIAQEDSTGKKAATDSETMPASVPDEKTGTRSRKKVSVRQTTTYTNSIGMNFRRIPAGEFLMGSPETERGRTGMVETQRRVQITTPFYAGVYEVTQGEFQQVMSYNPSFFQSTKAGVKTARSPVDSVNWFEAVIFCNALSREEGRSVCYKITNIERDKTMRVVKATVELRNGNGYRLPTEAEWEYLCRAGTDTAFSFGGTLSGNQANVERQSVSRNATQSRYQGETLPVGSFPANRWGLYDLHGNLYEWVQDTWTVPLPGGADPLTYSPNADSRGIRGGSYTSQVAHCRSATRASADASRMAPDSGFRIVLNTLP